MTRETEIAETIDVSNKEFVNEFNCILIFSLERALLFFQAYFVTIFFTASVNLHRAVCNTGNAEKRCFLEIYVFSIRVVYRYWYKAEKTETGLGRKRRNKSHVLRFRRLFLAFVRISDKQRQFAEAKSSLVFTTTC